VTLKKINLYRVYELNLLDTKASAICMHQDESPSCCGGNCFTGFATLSLGRLREIMGLDLCYCVQKAHYVIFSIYLYSNEPKYTIRQISSRTKTAKMLRSCKMESIPKRDCDSCFLTFRNIIRKCQVNGSGVE